MQKKTVTKSELMTIIEKHQHWLKKDCEGWEEMRADLHGINLAGVHLPGVNLSGANLYMADLSNAILHGANLAGADLRWANLRGTDLHDADMTGVNLHRANLSGNDLTGTNLSEAFLFCTNLLDANLSGAENVPFIPMTCPDVGSFVAWKYVDGYIVKLLIPDDARRSSGTSMPRACRSDKALVLAIENKDGSPADITTLVSMSNPKAPTRYTVGEMTFADGWDENRFKECTHGIHFFINRQEAVDYKRRNAR